MGASAAQPRSPRRWGLAGVACRSAAPSPTPAAAVGAHCDARQEQAALDAQRPSGSPQLRSRPLLSAPGPPGLAPTSSSEVPQVQLRDPQALSPRRTPTASLPEPRALSGKRRWTRVHGTHTRPSLRPSLHPFRWYRARLQGRGPGFNPWVGKIPQRRKWPPTPLCLSAKSHGQRSLAWGRKGRTRLGD